MADMVYGERYAPLIDGRKYSGDKKRRSLSFFNIFLILLMLSGTIFFIYRITKVSNFYKQQSKTLGGGKWIGYDIGKFSVNPRIELSDNEKKQIPRTLIPQGKLRIMAAVETGEDSYLGELDHDELHDLDGTYGIVEDLFDTGDSASHGEWKDTLKDLNFWIVNTDPPIIVPQVKYSAAKTNYVTPKSFKDSAQAESAVISRAADAVYGMENIYDNTESLSAKPRADASTFIDIGCDYTTPYIGVGIYSFLAAARGVSSIQCVVPPSPVKLEIPLILASRVNLYKGHFSVYSTRALDAIKKDDQNDKSHASVESIGGITFPSMHTAMLRFSADERVLYNAWKSASKLYTGSNPASQIIFPVPENLPIHNIQEILETMNSYNYKIQILPSGNIYDEILRSTQIGAVQHKGDHIQTDYLSIPQDKINEFVKLLSGHKGERAFLIWWTLKHDSIVHEMLHNNTAHYKKMNQHVTEGGANPNNIKVVPTNS